MARTTWGPLSTDEQNSIEFAPVGEPGVLVAGTAGGLLKRNADGTMGNSILSESGSVLTAAGSLRFSLTTEAGLRFNNLTTTQRNALTAGAGDAVWNTTTTRLNVHNGSAWTDGFVRLAGDTMTGPLVIGGGTVTASTPVLDLSQTWNLAGTTFTGLKFNVTDSASSPGSLIFDFQVAGWSKVWANKFGDLLVASSSRVRSNTGCFSLGSSDDVVLIRSAANTLDLRNGANAQTFQIYGTYTDASNYRRLRSTMTTGGAATIAAEGLGTGVSGNTLVLSQNGANVLSFDVSSNAQFTGNVFSQINKYFYWNTGSTMSCPANAQILLANNGVTDADFFLKFGVNTSAAAGIKRVLTELRARLNDDSGFATIQGKLRTDNAYVAGAVVGTGSVIITDSTGTAYRVPVLV